MCQTGELIECLEDVKKLSMRLLQAQMAEEVGGHYELENIFREGICLKLSTDSLYLEEYEVTPSFMPYAAYDSQQCSAVYPS